MNEFLQLFNEVKTHNPFKHPVLLTYGKDF